MTPDELKNLLNTLLAFSMLVTQQYEKYKEEQGFTDEEMRNHIASMNLEDDTKLHQLIQLGQAGNR